MTKLISHDARYEEVMPYLAPNPPITIILFKYVKKISNFKTENKESDIITTTVNKMLNALT